MEKEEKNKFAVRVFTFLVKQTVSPFFVFPGGGIAMRSVDTCLDSLEKLYKSELSRERIIDFCICQVYTISKFDTYYFRKWNVSHSFGKKAIERFSQNTSGKKYYEDRWLKMYDLSRQSLVGQFDDKSSHPLHKFIFPEYEETTKIRLHDSEAGFYICQISTLLWTPFSCACRTCKNEERCKNITSRKYPELYRIRNEEYNRNKE